MAKKAEEGVMAEVNEIEQSADFQRAVQAAAASEVRRQLAMLGISLPAPEAKSPTEKPDYIAFGSDAHAALLGLVKVQKDDDTTGYTTFMSAGSKITYRLEDEIGAVNLYPGMDPEKAVILVLRQKVNELEGGAPPIPANAPKLNVPVDPAMAPM